MILPHNPLQISVLYKNNSYITLTNCPSHGLQVRGFLFQIVHLEKQSQTGLFFEHFFPRSSERTFSLTFNNHPGFRQAVPFVLCAKRLCQVSAIRSNQGPHF